MSERSQPPDFPCVRKSCKSTFTRTSACYACTPTGRQTHVVLCEACLWCHEMWWTAAQPKVRVPTTLIAPWSPEGRRQLKSCGLYDPADPRCYESGIVPDKHRRQKEPQERQQ